MNKTWRSQQVDSEETEVFLKRSSVAELWWETFKKIHKNRSLKSSESNMHQLDPFNYVLSIPSKTYLKNYDENRAIFSLLGKYNENTIENKEVATIYHELFHVFQSNSISRVFDYFYLVDDIQRKRTKLLEYLGYANFYPLAEATNSDFGKTIFHSVENYGKLVNRDMYDSMFNEVIKERYAEIDEDIETFIAQYGESYREQFLKEAQSAKDSFKETIEEQINNSMASVQKQANDIKEYSNLSRSNIESLIEFFKVSNDINLNLFHLIEGSAEIFGWCCVGYNIDEKFNSREKKSDDTYDKAYELFKEAGGQTPLLFILLSTLALSIQSKNPIDVYIWSLEKVKFFEQNIKQSLANKEPTSKIFEKITLELIEQIENAYRGLAYTKNLKSIYDKEGKDTLFAKSISNLRESNPESSEYEFIIKLVLNQDIILSMIETFELNTQEFSKEIRKNEVMRDFEEFLFNLSIDFDMKCCKKHDFVKHYDYDEWLNCDSSDSFINTLTNDFKVNLPNKFKG